MKKQEGVIFETTTVIGAGEVPGIWRLASDGDSNAGETMDCLLAWSERQRAQVPKCINCDDPMGPVHIAAYAMMQDDSGDVTLVTAVCVDCASRFDGAHEVPAAVMNGLRRRGVNVIKLPDAGHA